MSKRVIHEKAHKAFWSGRITALCGFTAERGEYETAVFGFWSGKRCPACLRLKKERKRNGGTR